MDTMQLVSGEQVKVYTLKKGIKDTIMYDEKAVNERFGFGPLLIPDYKGLRGDPSDNIPGIKGIGEKTATTLVTAFGTIEDMYKELEGGEAEFTKAGMSPRIIQLLKDNKEEAEFSKMLATIRRDVPIEFKMSEKTFKEGLDMKKVSALWNELEFRTLTQRLENAITGKKVAGEKVKKEEQKPAEGKSGQLSLTSNINVSEEELEKTAIALWLVNSTITDPKIEDVYAFANRQANNEQTEDFTEAGKIIFAELDKRGLRKVYEDIELPLIPVIKKMEERGIKVDKALLAELSNTYGTELESLKKGYGRSGNGI